MSFDYSNTQWEPVSAHPDQHLQTMEAQDDSWDLENFSTLHGHEFFADEKSGVQYQHQMDNYQQQPYVSDVTNVTPVENYCPQQQQVVFVPKEETLDQQAQMPVASEELEKFFQEHNATLMNIIPDIDNLAFELQNIAAIPQPFPMVPGAEAPIRKRGRKKGMNGEKLKLDRCTCPNCLSGYNKLPGVKKVHLCHFPKCTKKYCTTSHLRAHLLTHQGIRPFACNHPSCGKSFTRSDELERHCRTHLGIRNYECNICKKKFIRSDHLSTHTKGHFAEKKPRKPRGKAVSKTQVEVPMQQPTPPEIQHVINIPFENDVVFQLIL